MSRYLIIDTHEHAVPRLGTFGRVLSPEESIAKFKEVFDEGSSAVSARGAERYDTQVWEDFKETL